MSAETTAAGTPPTLAAAGAAAPILPRSGRDQPHHTDTSEWLAWDRSDSIKAGAAAAISAAALTLMVLISLIIVSLASAHSSWLSPTARVGDYPSWLAGPLAPLTSWITFSSATLEGVFTFGIAAMYVAYVALLICAPRVRPAYALGAIVVLQLIFFVSPPLPLTDAFNYLNYGRMEVVHGLNPYTTIPALEPHTDPTFALSNWHGLESPYGPLFTLLTMAIVPLGVAGSYWAMKTLLLATSLASVFLIWRCAGLLGRHRLGAAMFLGLNPIVLVWGLGADHNDFLMIFLITLAMYVLIQARVRRAQRDQLAGESPTQDYAATTLAALRERARHVLAWIDGAPRPIADGEPGWWWEVVAGIALAGAVAIKASSAILIPVVLAGSARRLRLCTGLIIGFVGFGAATLAAFGPNLPDLSQQDRLVIPEGIPNLTGYVLGLGGETAGLRSVFTAALVLVVIGATVWAWRSRDWVLPAGLASLALLLSLSWELPWYIIWLLPFAALAHGRRIRLAAILLGVYMFLSWMPYATTFERDLGLNPVTTIVGRTNERYLHSLLDG
jgi:hypothetical protein